ncbi:MAG: RnfABCDGE type electron transport complex subunit B [Spirochaetales bacterium]|nr:RnfABCDGE type electron transport complex subunit B [Spirochaetales bacterium]
MMILTIIWAFLAVGLLGGLFGIGLAVASRILAVEKDERQSQVEELLPGANCGACGYTGCAGYAEAIVSGEASDLTLCTPGGPSTAEAVGDFMGVTVEVSGEKMVAQVHCRGTRDTSKYKFEYSGLGDCNALYASFKGDKECPYGCLGEGSCIKVCPVNAILKHSDGYIFVDKEKCISCGKCIDVCPTGVMKWMPYTADTFVACNSIDKGGVVRKYCSVGCIGCKMCEKKSPDGGFLVENFLATMDYSSTGSTDAAVSGCPTKCIIRLEQKVVPVLSENIEEKKED